MLAGIYFSHAPQAWQCSGTKLCVCECPRAHRVAGLCLALQPSSVPVPSLTVSMGHGFLYLVHCCSQADSTMSARSLNAMRREREIDVSAV